jgi:predicted lipoprotein with Yx(FWY)xxD motif
MSDPADPRILRSLRWAAVFVATAAGLAACASSSSSGGAGANTSAAPAPAAAAAVTVDTRKTGLGTFLTDKGGRALYLWDADTKGVSTCSGPCATAWPPLTVMSSGKATASGSAVQSDLATVKRTDGSVQVTYHGHPLYYFAQDASSKTTAGQGSNAFGATWWLVTPAGSADAKTAASQSSAGSGGGGGGYGGY